MTKNIYFLTFLSVCQSFNLLLNALEISIKCLNVSNYVSDLRYRDILIILLLKP